MSFCKPHLLKIWSGKSALACKGKAVDTCKCIKIALHLQTTCISLHVQKIFKFQVQIIAEYFFHVSCRFKRHQHRFHTKISTHNSFKIQDCNCMRDLCTLCIIRGQNCYLSSVRHSGDEFVEDSTGLVVTDTHTLPPTDNQ